MSAYGSYVVETILTLGGVSVLAFVLLYAARRAGVGRASGGVELVGRLPVDARRSVILVKVGSQVFVVGVSEAGLTRLGEVGAGSLAATAPPPVASFADVLRRAKADSGGPRTPPSEEAT